MLITLKIVYSKFEFSWKGPAGSIPSSSKTASQNRLNILKFIYKYYNFTLGSTPSFYLQKAKTKSKVRRHDRVKVMWNPLKDLSLF